METSQCLTVGMAANCPATKVIKIELISFCHLFETNFSYIVDLQGKISLVYYQNTSHPIFPWLKNCLVPKES